MGSAFHQLCPRYSGTLTPTAPTAVRLWNTFTFFYRADTISILKITKGNNSAKKVGGVTVVDLCTSSSHALYFYQVL